MNRLWLTAAIAVFVAAPAHAQTQRPAVAFTDDHGISIKPGGGLRVRVTNLLNRPQTVTISVVGLRPADRFTAGRFRDKRAKLPGRHTKVIVLRWRITGQKPIKPSYEGSIVLVGDRGPLVRQALTITTAVEPASACATADALDDAGQHEAAETAYQEVLKQDPTASCAKNALRHRSATAMLRHVLDEATAFGLVVLEWLALIVGVVAVLVLLLSKFVKSRKWLVGLGLIGDWLDRRLAPRLAIQDFSDAKGFTALVRDGLVRYRGDEPYRLDRMTARQSLGDRLSEIEAVDPAVKTLGAVLSIVEQLMPRAWFTATGSVQDKHISGEGATVILDGPRDPRSATLWLGATHTTDADHQPLAVPVAAWIDYEVHSQLTELAGIGDGESYALLQGGLDCERRGDVTNAERLYASAKAVDPTNLPAITNLANLKARGREAYLEAVCELR